MVLPACPALLRIQRQSLIHNRLATIIVSVVFPAIGASLPLTGIAASTVLASTVLAPAAGVAIRFAFILTSYHTIECRDVCFRMLAADSPSSSSPLHFSGSGNSSST